MKTRNLSSSISDRLKLISKEPEAETKIILEKVFGLNRLDIMLDKEIILTGEHKSELENILSQRKRRVPLQYIFKEQTFRNYTFYVDQRVLIPRPETELLVEEVIEITKKEFKNKKLTIADIGCGSGAIAISLALEIPESVVYTVDISPEALEVAKINKEKYKIPDNRLILLHGDRLELFKNKEFKFDIIVSNPPYIPEKEYLELEAEVINYEPEGALVGPGETGVGFYEYFAENAGEYLNTNGFLCFELGSGQAGHVRGILETKGIFKHIEVIKDYNGIERIITARLKI